MCVMAVEAEAPCQCFALDPAKTRGDDQRLTERVPGGAGAGLEGDVGAADARRFRRLISVFTA
jgi:hypothetical protein